MKSKGCALEHPLEVCKSVDFNRKEEECKSLKNMMQNKELK